MEAHNSVNSQRTIFPRVQQDMPGCIGGPQLRSPLIVGGNAGITDEKVFAGMGFGADGVPLDVVAILLTSRASSHCKVLITDEFLRFNGMNSATVEQLASRLERSILACSQAFQLPVTSERCSEFMGGAEYAKVLEEVKEIVAVKDLNGELLQTVPEKYRLRPESILYPLHEVACSYYLAARGYVTKLGPQSEQVYDRIMTTAGSALRFGYVIDALPVDTSRPTPVNHYIPAHRGKGHRLFMESSEAEIETRLRNSALETLRYFGVVSSEAGRMLWQTLSYLFRARRNVARGT